MIDQCIYRSRHGKRIVILLGSWLWVFGFAPQLQPSCRRRNDYGEVARPDRSSGKAHPGEPNHRPCLVSNSGQISFRRC